jgi:GT2 family glycosyltransferase
VAVRARETGPERSATDDATVSVIMPNRDRLALPLRALFGVARQTHPLVEPIVVDDGSTQDTTALRRAVEAMGGRFLVNPGPPGAAAARNAGVAAARGRYVAFLDSDDWFYPEKLATQRTIALAMEARGQRPALGCGMAFLKGGRLYNHVQPAYDPGLPVPEFLYARGGLFQTSSLFLPRDLALAVPFDPALTVHQDTDLMVRLFEAGADIALALKTLVAMDADPRPERITADPGRLEAARRWFEEREAGWSEAARKGFMRRDLCFRLAWAGHPLRALRGYFQSLEDRPPVQEMLSNALTLTIGEAPTERLLNLAKTLIRGPNQAPPDDPMLTLALADDARAKALAKGTLDLDEAFRRAA